MQQEGLLTKPGEARAAVAASTPNGTPNTLRLCFRPGPQGSAAQPAHRCPPSCCFHDQHHKSSNTALSLGCLVGAPPRIRLSLWH